MKISLDSSEIEIIFKDEREDDTFRPEKALENFLNKNLDKFLLPLIPPPLKWEPWQPWEPWKSIKWDDWVTPIKWVDYFTKKEVSEIKKTLKEAILSELPKILSEDEINIKFDDILKKINKLPTGGGWAMFLRQLMDVNVGTPTAQQYWLTYNPSRSEFSLTEISIPPSSTPTLQQVTDEWASTTRQSTFSGGIITTEVKASSSAWLDFKSNSWTDIGRLGAWGGAGVTWYGNHIYSQMTQGSVPFFGSNWLLSQDNTGFYYDDTLNRLSLFSTVGSEVITNGNFTGSASGWTLGSGWAYSSNAVNKSSNGTATLSQSITLYLQREYVLTYTISNWTAGTVTPALWGFTGTIVSANGTYTERFVAQSSSTITFTPSNTARFTIDSVSVKPMIGNSTRSNLNTWGLSVEGNWSNSTPWTTRAQTFNNDGSQTWVDYRFAGVLRGSEWFNSSGGKDTYVSWWNWQAWYWGNSGLTSNQLIAYLYQSGFVHYGFWYFGWKVNAGSSSTPATTLNSAGSFSTYARRVTANYTVTTADWTIYADASSAACSGTPTYACSHWTNQTDCEKWDAHGGCSWYAGDSCSVYNGDQWGCQGQSGCTYDTASCSSFGDESSCNGTSGCSWTNNPLSCSGFDEYTCSMTSGCTVDTGYCSWDGMTCSGGGDCSAQMDESSCLSYSYYNGCSGSYDNYSCSGDYYTGNCSGTYGAVCQGSPSCAGIDDSTNCGFETGCTWSTSITVNLPSVVTVPNMHLWVYNDSSSSADVILQPYSGDTIDKTTSYTLGTHKDAIHAQAFSEYTTCSVFNEWACTPSGCSPTYSNCSWDSGSNTCSGNAVCDGIGDQSTCESTTYYSGCSGIYYTVKNWYLLSRS